MPTLFDGVFDFTPEPKKRRLSAVGPQAELLALLDAILVEAGLPPPVLVEASIVDTSVEDPNATCPCTPPKMTDAELDALLSSTSGP